MRVLVTGGAGFIGMHLCSALIDRGDRVAVMDSLTEGYDPAQKLDNLAYLTSKSRIDFIKGDIRDERACDAALKEADAVCHLAGLAGVRNRWNVRSLCGRQHQGNGGAAFQSGQNGVRGVVFASSSSVYGDGAVLFPKTRRQTDLALRRIQAHGGNSGLGLRKVLGKRRGELPAFGLREKAEADSRDAQIRHGHPAERGNNRIRRLHKGLYPRRRYGGRPDQGARPGRRRRNGVTISAGAGAYRRRS